MKKITVVLIGLFSLTTTYAQGQDSSESGFDPTVNVIETIDEFKEPASDPGPTTTINTGTPVNKQLNSDPPVRSPKVDLLTPGR